MLTASTSKRSPLNLMVAIDQHAEKALGNRFSTGLTASAKPNAVFVRVNERHPLPLGGQPL
jgi:hypothetical protein